MTAAPEAVVFHTLVKFGLDAVAGARASKWRPGDRDGAYESEFPPPLSCVWQVRDIRDEPFCANLLGGFTTDGCLCFFLETTSSTPARWICDVFVDTTVGPFKVPWDSLGSEAPMAAVRRGSNDSATLLTLSPLRKPDGQPMKPGELQRVTVRCAIICS